MTKPRTWLNHMGSKEEKNKRETVGSKSRAPKRDNAHFNTEKTSAAKPWAYDNRAKNIRMTKIA